MDMADYSPSYYQVCVMRKIVCLHRELTIHHFTYSYDGESTRSEVM